MKKTFSLLTTSLIGIASATAQCSPSLNNFEIRLTPIGQNNLKVQMRYHADAVAGAESVLPKGTQLLDGLVFGITWPKTSNVSLTSCKSATAPFAVSFDNSSSNVQNKTNSIDNVQTLFHNNLELMPTAFGFTWENDKWFDIANVTFSGTLAEGDYFSLLTCDYGLAHPNSFSGNSTTDPWFAMMDEQGNYVQYSPKMITELPSFATNNVTFYPVPTSGELNIDVETTNSTSAVVKVMDMTGRIVKTVLFDLEKGKNKNQINIGDIPNGDYLIQLTDGKALNYSKQVSKQ